jgi:general secretion pathway protein G
LTDAKIQTSEQPMRKKIPIFATSSRRGFTLVEILIVVIILGILAAIVMPQFSNASQDSKADALRAQLRTVRSAIEVYQMQHIDQLPDLVGSWTPLLTQTNARGGTTGTPLFGPYMTSAPVNSLTGGSHIGASAGSGVDWVWTPGTGKISALDAAGNPFDESP